MARRTSSIVEQIEQSRLLSDRELSEAQVEVAGLASLSDAAYVNRLVEFGLLTAWQGLQLLAGRTSFFVGPYKLLQRIGHGGAAAVYKAQHTTIGQIVALKVFPTSLSQVRDAAARFRRETEASVRVNHPHVVSGYGSKCFDGRGVLIMEFVNGDDLSRWLKRCGSLPIDWCCEAARQAALGLGHIHQRGLVHRDIKPSNVLAVGASGRETPHVKVADLGAANIKYNEALSSQTQLTALGTLLGTPNYMSPEQIEDGHGADPRSDIFSLGCTLFKLLSNELPWTGATLEERLKARMKQPPLRVRQFRRDIPPRIEQIIEAMLARRPENRPASADEVAGELAAFARSKGAESPTAAVANPAAPSPAEPWPPILRIRGREPETVVLPPAPPVTVQTPLEWRLLRESLQGPPQTSVMREQDTVVVGRGRDCHIRVRDVQVSRRHCQFAWRNGGWQIEDLGSQNGTYVNGLSATTCELNSGDQIRIGSTRLWIVAVCAVDAVAAAGSARPGRRGGPATA
ncbi:MAG TPA: protein kinase [Pirellulales bacterium]|nr:protein kinase [Pirellulales bacterium]